VEADLDTAKDRQLQRAIALILGSELRIG
jgi:hypothetical protein